MKQILSRLKAFLGIMIWDLLTAVAFFALLIVFASTLDNHLIRVILVITCSIFILLMLTLKFRVMYKQYGKDDVTRRKNKREFEQVAKELIRGNWNYVLVYANIDRFKLINDAYGDKVGDHVLRKIHKIIDDELLWNGVGISRWADGKYQDNLAH